MLRRLKLLVLLQQQKLLKRWCTQSMFVPEHRPCQDLALNQLQEFIDKSRKLFVLTGAGISTESGIPDYRSEKVGLYATSSKRPVQYKKFMESAKVRQSYWARNYIGWPRFSSFKPNISHRTLAEWERKGKVHCVVTQNVDRLHHKAGSSNVHELHGTTFNVKCMSCGQMVARHSFQTRLKESNLHMSAHSLEIRPDGDVELTQEEVNNFQVPSCEKCGGFMKPDIVFFGDNVPRHRVESVRKDLAACDSMLVLGSSLYVYSGYRGLPVVSYALYMVSTLTSLLKSLSAVPTWAMNMGLSAIASILLFLMKFILQAAESGIRICAINIGLTRAEKHFFLRIHARCGEVLPQIII